MEIREDQLDERTLVALAGHAIELICARDFDSLTQRFPYALTYDRVPAAAVATDLGQCFSEAPSLEAALTPENANYNVGYFEPNEITLHALVECRFVSASGDTLLVELVVIGKERMALALEDISVVLGEPAG